MKLRLIVICIALLITTHVFAQHQTGFPTKSGKCYAKCLIQDSIDVWTENVFLFLGEDNLDTNIEDYEIVITPAISEWIKTKSDRNCLSGNPEDCLIWSYIERPAEIETIMIVIDTSLTKEFVEMEIEQSELVKAGGFTEWREVVCNADLNSKLIERISLALKEKGFYPDNPKRDKANSLFKNSLVAYQKYFNLPIGQVDFETLRSLGIPFNR